MIWQITPVNDGCKFLDLLGDDDYVIRDKLSCSVEDRSLLFKSEEAANNFILNNLEAGKFKAEEIYG